MWQLSMTNASKEARTNETPLLVRISVHRNEYRTKY
jgi:hypothetical protein